MQPWIELIGEAARRLPPPVALVTALGFGNVESSGQAGERAAVSAMFAASETFRWLRRWAVMTVVAIVTPITGGHRSGVGGGALGAALASLGADCLAALDEASPSH